MKNSHNVNFRLTSCKEYEKRQVNTRASAEKFPGGGSNEKRPKNSTIKPLPGGGGAKNSTIKPLSTISLPRMKIQGEGGNGPRCRHPWVNIINTSMMTSTNGASTYIWPSWPCLKTVEAPVGQSSSQFQPYSYQFTK